MSNQTEIAAGIDISANVNNALTQIGKLDKGLESVNKQLVDILQHFEDLNKKTLGNINKQINNVTQNRNIANQNIGNNYDLGSARKVAKSSTGAVMTSDTGREKAFRDYEQAIIDETKEITADIAEQKRLRKQRADTEAKNAENERQRVAKKEDQSTAAYAARMDKLAEAKLLNAKANQAGALLNNPRYQYGKAFQNIGQKVGTIGVGSDKLEGKAIGGVISALGGLLKSPIAGGAAALTSFANGIVEVGKAATQAYAEIESIKTQLGVVFSNQTQADSMFGEISQYAVKSPFGVQQTSELAVLLKQSGVYASDLMDTLKMIGDTAGGNMEKMKRIANNYAQIVSIGKASMLDMRQFAYAGIPIFEAVSKELGVSQQELRKLISDGKVTSDIIEKVFKDLTGINGIFENATEKGAKTLKARLQNLADAKQLAMAGVGEYLVNIGTNTGNDSVVNNVVTGVEEIYQWLKDKVNTVNIEKSVQAIEAREARIVEIDKLREKYKDDPRISKLLDIAMNTELSKRNVDSERNIYNKSYTNKINKSEAVVKFKEQYGEFDLNDSDVKNVAELLRRGRLGYLQLRGKDFDPLHLGDRKANELKASAEKLGYSVDELFDLNLTKEEIKSFTDSLRDASDALNGKLIPTINDIKAHTESKLIDAQQSAYDLMNSQSDKSGSLLSKFRDISSAYRDTDKYKEQEEKKRVETLTQALEVLKDIRKNTDDSGRIDITKFSATQLSDYIKQGAFTASEKLNVVTGNSEIDRQNREDLMKQYGHIVELTGNFMKVALNDSRYSSKTSMFESSVLTSLSKLSDSEFYEQFPKTYEQQTQALDDLIKSLSDNDGRKQMLQMYRGLLDYSLNKIETDVTGADASAGDLTKNSGNEFIPLWKRILAQYTGLSTTEMTSAQKTLESYRDDMSVRNMASGVASAMMKSGNYNSALKLFAAGNAQQLKEDSSATLQVDWKTTRQNIKNFALSLSATTDVVDAYKKGLEDELDTYQQLIIAGRTQGESQNGGTNQFISVKKLAQFAQTNAQLVNAFGDELVTKNGTYKVSDIEVRKNEAGETELYYLGNKIEDQIMVTDTLTRFLKKELPRLQEEIAEANIHSAMLVEIERLQAERKVSRASIVSQSAILTGNLKSSNIDSASILSTKQTNQTGYLINQKVGEAFENIFKKIAEMNPIDLVNPDDIKDEKERNAAIEASKEIGVYGKTDDEKSQALIVLRNLQTVFNNGDIKDITTLTYALQKFFEAFPDASKKIVEESEKTVKATQEDELIKAADELLKNSPLSIGDALRKDRDFTNNSIFEQGIMEALGLSRRNFSDLNTKITDNILENPSENTELTDKYTKGILSSIKKEGKKGNLSPEEVEEYSSKISELAESEDFKEIKNFLTNHEMGNIWDKVTESTNKWALSLGNVGKTLDDISSHIGDVGKEFLASAITSSMSIWGETLAKGEDSSEAIVKNLAQLSANMLSDIGAYLTKAGLSLAISSIGDKAGVMAGLAIAAAGGGMSFLGGYLNGAMNKDDKSKEDSELEKLLRIKQDLSDLLKQAREDAIYYENTVRHKNAIGANEQFKVKSVNDAVITPSGQVVTTDPKDYLIATKTPRQLIGGGAPTINFSVIDKSTGIKVTQQKSTYDEQTNSINFEAIIESKVQEIIATSKGDDAFNAREARINGRTVIA